MRDGPTSVSSEHGNCPPVFTSGLRLVWMLQYALTSLIKSFPPLQTTMLRLLSRCGADGNCGMTRSKPTGQGAFSNGRKPAPFLR